MSERFYVLSNFHSSRVRTYVTIKVTGRLILYFFNSTPYCMYWSTVPRRPLATCFYSGTHYHLLGRVTLLIKGTWKQHHERCDKHCFVTSERPRISLHRYARIVTSLGETGGLFFSCRGVYRTGGGRGVYSMIFLPRMPRRRRGCGNIIPPRKPTLFLQ